MTCKRGQGGLEKGSISTHQEDTADSHDFDLNFGYIADYMGFHFSQTILSFLIITSEFSK